MIEQPIKSKKRGKYYHDLVFYWEMKACLEMQVKTKKYENIKRLRSICFEFLFLCAFNKRSFYEINSLLLMKITNEKEGIFPNVFYIGLPAKIINLKMIF